ncbi:MAG: flagellar basal body rod protein FlgC [Deltaproteobacteria bacterium]|nr:flagellar basal body rod protein FlgC [Deltaproteobacteria bacterium]
MDIFKSLQISASGLSAQRKWMDTIASNLANSRATRTPEGGPYRRRDPVFLAEPVQEGNPVSTPDTSRMGVKVASIAVDPSPPNLVFEPGHPDANAEGYVAYPNVSVMEETVNMVAASRSYEANLQAFNAFKNMALRALDLFR